MFMNDVYKKEEIRNVAIEDLRNKFGIKYRAKKIKQAQDPRSGKKVFKRPLNLLPLETVTLPSGQQLIVPRTVHQLCDFILKNADTEGLFRKGGSKSRQNEIKLLLDAGCTLCDEHQEIDVANVLKTFLRELPDPLIPYSFHDLFLRCTLLEENKIEAILLACLLLPTEHLNTLAYIMQFFRSITDHSVLNKMDAYNLAVVIGPSVFPTEEKIAADTQQRLFRTCELFKMLIENANSIGILPENILERIASSNYSSSLSEDDSTSKKKKKRRSGSLTRMFNGIKKMVGSKTSEDTVVNVVTPDLLLTPCIRKSVKKRRVDISSISARRKRDVLNTLPDGALRTPVIPGRTPVSENPYPRKTSPLTSCKPVTREKKKQWYSRGRINKVDKTNASTTNTTHSQSTKSLFERRLSAVSQSSTFRKMKKRISCDAQLLVEPPLEQPDTATTDQGFVVEPDYVKISRSEYEEIKNRVSAIERRISVELQSAGIEEDSDKSVDNAINNVQYAYQKTLVEAEPLSPSTDHIARRLSRELKIRRSCEQRVHRSPSARKIGSLRRRSREREKQNVELKRNQSWHVNPRKDSPRTPVMTSNAALNIKTPPTFTLENKFSRSPASFHGTPIKTNSAVSPSGNWKTVEDVFTHSGVSTISSDSSRTPLDKLRNQNAGLVMEKAKFFNGLSETREMRRNKASTNRRIGAQRNQTSRLLKVDDKLNGKKSLSPQKRKSKSPRQKVEYDTEKENIGVNSDVGGKLTFSGLKECNRIETLSCNNIVVRGTPTIKRNLCTRSPKQLCKTPRMEAVKGCTPLKAKPVLKM